MCVVLILLRKSPVNCSILLNTFSSYEIRGQADKWFRNFLTEL